MRKLIIVIVGVVALTTGCNMRHNQQMGSVTGAVAGGLLGNTIGKGRVGLYLLQSGHFLERLRGVRLESLWIDLQRLSIALNQPHSLHTVFVRISPMWVQNPLVREVFQIG